jgi:hypothetical protein
MSRYAHRVITIPITSQNKPDMRQFGPVLFAFVASTVNPQRPPNNTTATNNIRYGPAARRDRFRVVVLMTAACAQQSHWATPDDKTAKFMIDMERKWAEGVCTDNGVISELLADDFQGTSTRGERYNKADEPREEKGPHSARGCALDDAKVRFFGEDVAII